MIADVVQQEGGRTLKRGKSRWRGIQRIACLNRLRVEIPNIQSSRCAVRNIQFAPVRRYSQTGGSGDSVPLPSEVECLRGAGEVADQDEFIDRGVGDNYVLVSLEQRERCGRTEIG